MLWTLRQPSQLPQWLGGLCLALSLAFLPTSAGAFPLAYSGRLKDAHGVPVAGPSDLTVRFFTAAQNGQQLGSSLSFPGTALTQGIFNLTIDLSDAENAAVFNTGAADVFVEVEANSIIYPRQELLAVPYALRVPTDGTTVSFNGNGQLSLALTSAPAANQYLSTDSHGALIWATPARAGSGITALTQVNVQPPLMTSGGSSPQLSLGAASAATSGYLQASDWTTFSAKLASAGGTLTGALAMGGAQINSLGTPTTGSDAVPKGYADSTIGGQSLTQSGAQDGDVLVWTGGGLQLAPLNATGSGGGLTSLNGDPAPAQILAVTTGGSSPEWLSGSGTQTLLLPLASSPGVGAGLVANADYLGFSVKQNAIGPGSSVNAGSLTSVAQFGFEMRPWGPSTGQTGELRFDDLSGAHYVGFKAPDGAAANSLLTLPMTLGAAGQVLGTSGSGTLTWLASAAASGSAGGDLTGSYPNPSLVAVGVAGVYQKVTTDSKGRIIAGTSLAVTDLPLMHGDSGIGGSAGLAPAPAAGSGSAGYLQANGTWSVPTALGLAGGDLSGNYPNPTLTATGITPGTYTKVSIDSKGRATIGFSLLAADLPNLPAAQFTSGTLAAANGGTGVNSAATFPAAGVVVTETGLESLTGKSLTSVTINGASTIAGATTIAVTGTANVQALNAVGPLTVQGTGTVAGKLILTDRGSLYGLTLKSPDTLGATTTWTLPAGDGAGGALLTTNGAGSLGWTVGAVPAGTAGGDLTGTYPGPTLTATGVSLGTYPKIAVDSKGRVFSGMSLSAADIPGFPAAALTSGTLAMSLGGTGVSALTAGGVVYGTGTTGMAATSSGLAYQALVLPFGSTAPVFGPVNLGQAAAVSGLLPSASGGTGTLSTATFPSSGIVVTEAGSETLTNKTLTAAVINGATQISGAATISISGSVTAATVTGSNLQVSGPVTANVLVTGLHTATTLTTQGPLQIQGNGSTADKLILNDSGTTNALSFKSPDTLSGSTTWILPPGDGSAAAFLATNGSGSLSWQGSVVPTTGFGGDLTGSFPSPQLIAAGVSAGTYTKVSVDAKGRVVAGTSLGLGDIPSLPASVIAGPLPVSQGGTGTTNLAANSVVLGNGTGPLTTVAAGAANQVLRMPGAGSAPVFGAVDLTQSAAVSGSLAIVNGGTGATTAAGAHTALGAAAQGINGDITALTALSTVLPVSVGGSGVSTLTPYGVLYGNGGSSLQSAATATAGLVLQAGPAGVPQFAAWNLAQAAAVTGTLPVANGGLGTAAVAQLGQLPLGNGTNFSFATLTPGTGINITNAAGSINIAANLTGGTLVPVAGSTMTGKLSLASNGLTVGTNQLVVAGGYVGMGSGTPGVGLDINGFYRLTKYAAAPAACTAATDGAMAMTMNYTPCICSGGVWYASGGTALCAWALHGEADFLTPGSYTWYVPPGVTSVSVVAVGGGGPTNYAGGGGGGLCYLNNIAVTPGASIPVVVAGPASLYSQAAGGTSSFNGSVIQAYGGGTVSGGSGPGGVGGGGSAPGGVCNTGGAGGSGGSQAIGGSGGAAGYTGNGGHGGDGSYSAITTNQTAGAGGGGGGGGGSSFGSGDFYELGNGGGGGGVGLYGIGANGAAGASSTGGALGQTPGGGGSGGAPGGGSGTIAPGGNFGGGGYGIGAVRIIWGSGRSFPNAAQ